jgi:hypothetical protein
MSRLEAGATGGVVVFDMARVSLVGLSRVSA